MRVKPRPRRIPEAGAACRPRICKLAMCRPASSTSMVPGGCVKCHSPSGDLAGVATRYEGLQLEERMLYPRDAKSTVTVTLPSGEKFPGEREREREREKKKKKKKKREILLTGLCISCLQVLGDTPRQTSGMRLGCHFACVNEGDRLLIWGERETRS